MSGFFFSNAVRRRARPRGVTAVELLTLIVLMVIIGAIAIPSMSPVVLRYRLRGAAWQLGGELRLARQRAVTIKKRFRVCVSGCVITVPAGTYSLERDDGTPGNQLWVSETGTPTKLPQDVTVSATATATFATNGMIVPGSTFTLTNLMGTYQVAVNSTGRIRVCEGTC